MSIERVDTLVIGGGLNGCGVAYYLAREGVDSILLVEADDHGAGATGGSMGNVRQQFGTPLEIECSRRGLAFWKSIDTEFDVPSTFHEDGYLMLTGDEATADLLRKHRGVQVAEGMPDVHLLDPGQVSDLVPFINPEGLVLGSYTPEDGHVMPMDGVAAFVKGGRELGVRIRRHWRVDKIERAAGDWIVTGPEAVAARRVVVAAGIGTKALLQPFGVDLQMYEGTHRALLTDTAYPGQRVPTTVDVDTGMIIEREGDQFMLAMLSRNPAPRDHEHLTDLFIGTATRRAPDLLGLEIVNRLTAYPILGGDGQPYVGPVEENLWALAFTGHGAMHGPPVAEAVAKAMAGQPDPTLNLSEWDVRRTPKEQTVIWRRSGKE